MMQVSYVMEQSAYLLQKETVHTLSLTTPCRNTMQLHVLVFCTIVIGASLPNNVGDNVQASPKMVGSNNCELCETHARTKLKVCEKYINSPSAIYHACNKMFLIDYQLCSWMHCTI